ncbi:MULTISPECIES: hypothetical protein [Thermodesulfovibrio]|jgi:hypothetical protein|uniref:hypothetical protein n=1 Tax=Thermodesulfovibrio TaxID=28261 RepID=UPI00262CFDFD|nr:hypothetical protein [Thermodesulfovibrio sp.]
MKQKTNPKNFKIADLWLASALALTLKVDPELTTDGDKVVFNFPFTVETLKALDGLSTGEIKFDYISYSEKFRNLKHQMMNLKKLRAGSAPA